jgi:hydroxyethylthiazole kinase
MDWIIGIKKSLAKIKKKRPLIHNITNFVVMNTTANSILAVGASPIMAHAIEEVAELSQVSSAVVLNIGTLSNEWVDSMILAGETANRYHIPVILDPVGVGASSLRNISSRKILERVKCSIIRANASEILALAGLSAKIQGVDALQESEDLLDRAKEIAKKLGSVIAVTGKQDIVCDGDSLFTIDGGDPMFKKVTGTGCASSAICACFAAVENDFATAACQALAYYKFAGEEAIEHSRGPGSFQVALLDSLANADPIKMQNKKRICEV